MSSNRRLFGAALAISAAAVFLANTPVLAADDATTVKVKCYGANACKGKSECKTALSSCKGQNACKGKGFVKMTERECIEALSRKK